ncbi:alpha-L-fucosidase, partial [Gemmatimonadota bacterium]
MDRKRFLLTLGGGAASLSFLGCREDSDGQTAAGLPAFGSREEMQRWFREARFGMFIHWGVYSLLGKGEWVMHNDCMTARAYEELPPRFNPTLFDPAEWVSAAKMAGMRYITITSKHHDGFAMWHSRVSSYNVVDATSYGRDILRMLAAECARQDIRLFFYHSHLDWHHPDYFPRGKTGGCSGRPEAGEFDRYLDTMDAQLGELLSGEYGQLGGIWFDGWWDHHVNEQDKDDIRTSVDWRLERTYELVHRLQPTALIGNNHHVTPFPGEDFQIVERDLPGQNTFGYNTTAVSDLPLETCDTMNGSWGYNASDQRWKTTPELIHLLVRSSGHDANLLLNVGPTPEGTFQPEVHERLRGLGEWTSRFGETVYGTRGGPMPPQAWGVTTQKGGRLFVHILDAQAPSELTLPGTAHLRPEYARALGSGAPVAFRAEGDIRLTLD